MRTLVSRSVIVLSAGLVLCGLTLGQEPNTQEPNALARQPFPTTGTNQFTPAPVKLFSPSVSRLFYEMAYEIIHREDITDSQAEQAVVLLNAAMDLDVSTGFATADMLTIASRPGPARHLPMLYNSLIKYVNNKDADCQVATNAARYLLEQLDSRQQREILLGRLMQDIGESNPSVRSELATELGLLYAEKADDPNAARALATAYNWNRYNRLAFEKLVELTPEQISPVLYLEYLRLKLRENPLDIDTALGFAQYAQKVQLYDVAADSYQYCTDLFQFLYPGQDVPIAIYIDWMTSCYNTTRSQPRCLQLAEQLRKQDRFDLQIEVLAAKTAAKTGDINMAEQIFKTAEQKAIHLADLADQNANYKPLAWFYCFVRLNPEKAADWANKAYSAEPNSPLAAGLLACALADNNQLDSAKPLIDNYPQTQLATLAQAKLYLAAGQKQPAIESLRAAIDKDPGSIVAEQARMLLTKQQADYIPIFDTSLILADLRQTAGEQLVPQFVSPDKILSFQLNIRGNRFSYGNDFDGVISITNNWYEPLVISEKGLCRGRITIDANITGDITRRIEKLVSTTTRPSLPIKPGHSALVPVRLCTGPLRELLLNHPQASLNIQFTAYLDPVVTSDGSIVSTIPGIKPATVQIERPRVEITTEFLQNRFTAMSKGRQSPKIKAVRLFAGLLMEDREMANHRGSAEAPSYKLANADWMAPMLKSVLAQGLTDSDWVVKVHSMAAIADLPLDYELTNAAGEGLNDQHWPARMMAVWLLAQKQGDSFAKVLDRTAQYDSSEFVRNMAIALGAKIPEPNQTLEQPFLDLLRQEPNSDSNGLRTPPPQQ